MYFKTMKDLSSLLFLNLAQLQLVSVHKSSNKVTQMTAIPSMRSHYRVEQPWIHGFDFKENELITFLRLFLPPSSE